MGVSGSVWVGARAARGNSSKTHSLGYISLDGASLFCGDLSQGVEKAPPWVAGVLARVGDGAWQYLSN